MYYILYYITDLAVSDESVKAEQFKLSFETLQLKGCQHFWS